MPLITKKGKEALHNYKYRSAGKSWLDSNIMNPFWESVVSIVPMNVAPNVLTFGATLTFLHAYAWWLLFSYDLSHCAPRWVYFLLAISMWIYQTLDAIDGKQARRTHTSSPLGQLFDHGNDAFAFTPMLISTMGALGYVYMCVCVIYLFIIS